MRAETPSNIREILDSALKRVKESPQTRIVNDLAVAARIEIVARNLQNRAVVRLILTCALAKAIDPKVDARKPYTEIGGDDSFSGRTLDEAYVGSFVSANNLPCNNTTAFLTPALRNRNVVLTPDLNLVGRPPIVYSNALQILTDLQAGKVSATDLLAETIRVLLLLRDEQQQRMDSLMAGLRTLGETIPLSAEGIVTLIEQHLASPNASRLPVLVVAAAYVAGGAQLGERAKALESHNAADKQTGSIGDVEVTLIGEDEVVTGYEMKMKRVTIGDIDLALSKLQGQKVQNYIFITTDRIDVEVQEYAASLYEKTGGIEIVVLDCIGFLRHFLHLFHRRRGAFVEAYQKLVLSQPNSAVGHPLKESWLALRQAAEALPTEDAEE